LVTCGTSTRWPYKLKHPNIIKIHEFNTDGVIAYLVLELYSEQNMKQALASGPEAWAYYIPKIVSTVVGGLVHLHSRRAGSIAT
jgi:eukaryotic-like serine/threonine-protein kinase